MNDDSYSFLTEVVGCYYYGGVYGRYEGEVLLLRRNPRNPYDINAIEVLSTTGKLLGHLPRQTAAWFAKELDAGIRAHAVILHVDYGYIPSSSRNVRGRSPGFRPPRLKVRVVRQSAGSALTNANPQLDHHPTQDEHLPALGSPVSTTVSQSKSNCFIVTAAYGYADHPVVQFFRAWRDVHLQESLVGRFFLRSYYAVGPVMAAFVRRVPSMGPFLRKILGMLARFLGYRPQNNQR